MKILTAKCCFPSAKLLRDSLVNIVGRNILVTSDASKIRGPFIRYGSAENVRVPDTKYNSAEFVRLVSDKLKFSKKMEEHDIYSPKYNANGTPNAFPVIIRKTLTSFSGRGIVVCPDLATFQQNWQPGYFWTPFVKINFELRVHVLGGKIVKIMKKVLADDQVEVALPIRNQDAGYHYAAKEVDAYPKLNPVVGAIDQVLGGKFYSLDVGWDKQAQKYFVFEANSGSGLNPQTVELYADYLAREFYNNL